MFGFHVTGTFLPYTLTGSKFGEHLFLSSSIILFIFSGHEVGPLLLEVPVTIQASSLSKNKAISDRLCDLGSVRQNTDFSSGYCGITVLEDSCLLKKVRIGSLLSPYSSCLFSIFIFIIIVIIIIHILVFPNMFGFIPMLPDFLNGAQLSLHKSDMLTHVNT